MPISIRFYLVPDDGSLRRISQRIADALRVGRDAIPEYAGTTQRVAQVIAGVAAGGMGVIDAVRPLALRPAYPAVREQGRAAVNEGNAQSECPNRGWSHDRKA